MNTYTDPMNEPNDTPAGEPTDTPPSDTPQAGPNAATGANATTGPNTTTGPNDTTGPRRLTRTRDGRMLAGVCSGAASYFNVDPTIVRIALAVVTLLTSGAAVLLYVAAVLIVPEEGKDLSIAQELINKQTRQPH